MNEAIITIVGRIAELESKLPKKVISKKEFLREYMTIDIKGKIYPFIKREVFLDMEKEGLVPKGIEPIPLKYAKEIDKVLNP